MKKLKIKEEFEFLSSLRTEKINPKTKYIDILPTIEILKLINNEDKKVPRAITKELNSIEQATELVIQTLKNNGRLVYIGAGTSGRLGVLDAAECPPTFSTDPNQIIGVIAGGDDALKKSIEGAEDNIEQSIFDLKKIKLNKNDILCGIAASGRTPYVLSALKYAKEEINCKTIFITTSAKKNLNDLKKITDVIISINVGAEVIAGSTRMKSGTAQKLVLNMISTTAMIKLGKTLNNVMIDLQIKNNKLKNRALRILKYFTNLDIDSCEELLQKSKGNLKIALLIHFANLNYEKAKKLLKDNDGFIKLALKKINKEISL